MFFFQSFFAELNSSTCRFLVSIVSFAIVPRQFEVFELRMTVADDVIFGFCLRDGSTSLIE